MLNQESSYSFLKLFLEINVFSSLLELSKQRQTILASELSIGNSQETKNHTALSVMTSIQEI
mgnify:CR=1 FL=1